MTTQSHLDEQRKLNFQRIGISDEDSFLTEYMSAWNMQRRIHEAVAEGRHENTVLLLQHPSVYTAGRSTKPDEKPFDGTPVIDIDRGGKITWHGPGQLVGYPIIHLADGYYVVDYVRRLEEALIRTCDDLGVLAGRVDGRTGVWLPATDDRPERKLIAIGVRVAKRTTMHGFAFNVRDDMAAFGNIVPCGIADAGVTSLAQELETVPSLSQVADAFEPHMRELLEDYGPFDIHDHWWRPRDPNQTSDSAPKRPTTPLIQRIAGPTVRKDSDV